MLFKSDNTNSFLIVLIIFKIILVVAEYWSRSAVPNLGYVYPQGYVKNVKGYARLSSYTKIVNETSY